MGCICVQPLKPKVRILQEEGFPVLSKRIANKIGFSKQTEPEKIEKRKDSDDEIDYEEEDDDDFFDDFFDN